MNNIFFLKYRLFLSKNYNYKYHCNIRKTKNKFSKQFTSHIHCK